MLRRSIVLFVCSVFFFVFFFLFIKIIICYVVFQMAEDVSPAMRTFFTHLEAECHPIVFVFLWPMEGIHTAHLITLTVQGEITCSLE